jgi:hypothetical protein
MSLVLLVTAFLGFNSMTGSEPIQTVISAPVVDQVTATPEVIEQEVVVATPEVSTTAPKAKVNAQQLMDDLAFESAQLESAVAMLEALQLLEGKE